MVMSDVGLILFDVLFKGEFLSPVLSESDGESSTSSRFSCLPSQLLPSSFSAYIYSSIQIKMRLVFKFDI